MILAASIFVIIWAYISVKYVAANIWMMPTHKKWHVVFLELPCALVIILIRLGASTVRIFKKLIGKDKK